MTQYLWTLQLDIVWPSGRRTLEKSFLLPFPPVPGYILSGEAPDTYVGPGIHGTVIRTIIMTLDQGPSGASFRVVFPEHIKDSEEDARGVMAYYEEHHGWRRISTARPEPPAP